MKNAMPAFINMALAVYGDCPVDLGLELMCFWCLLFSLLLLKVIFFDIFSRSFGGVFFTT